MTVKDFHVGQTVYIVRGDIRERRNDLAEKVEIVKVGRKYVTINGNWGQKFKETDKDTAYLVEHTEYGNPDMLFPSKNALEEFLELCELKMWILREINWNKVDQYTLWQLRKVKEILEGTVPGEHKGG